MKHRSKRLLGIVLSVALVLGLIPGMSMTAYAGTATYTNLIPTNNDDATAQANKQVTFNGYKWYIIEDNSTANNAGTVTLLVADTSFGIAMFADGTNVYSNSAIKRTLDTYTDSGTFKDIAEAIINTSNGRLYLLSSEEAQNLPSEVLKANFTGGNTSSGEWWLRTAVSSGGHVAIVNGADGSLGDRIPAYDYGVRPALQLDLSKVTFDSTSKTFLLKSASAAVTGVTLNPSAAQKVGVGGTVKLTVTVSPSDTADKTVKWSVSGAAVKLYADAACIQEVGTTATETLTVYAKGVSVGSATVTATSNANSNKYASCAVTVQDVPDTGDAADFGLWAALLAIGLSGIGLALTAGKRRKEQ